MKIQQIILPLVVVGFMIWALMEQASNQPRLWVQVIGVALFFLAMARLMQKTPSNAPKKSLMVRSDAPTDAEEATEDYSITVVDKKSNRKHDVK
ncbi:hypothetical protein M2306_001849 [Myroides gitamensis]|uniref:hypothetical protein n=1 Tax=Myroides odoratus TaxID=256 RepID=UPI002167D24B|nr:hypothetical protein [Myroides odoratus]MCS4239767.1 hypothetical protein [Myroides odoratus]MDH6601155.1 hypothetical protein [Myroides gitamensis]